MIADVIIALVCGLILFVLRRLNTSSTPPTAPQATTALDLSALRELPPDLLWAVLGLALFASAEWVEAARRFGPGPTFASVFSGDEPLWATQACHAHQDALTATFNAKAAMGNLDLRCPAGGRINGTPGSLSCTLHGTSRPP